MSRPKVFRMPRDGYGKYSGTWFVILFHPFRTVTFRTLSRAHEFAHTEASRRGTERLLQDLRGNRHDLCS